MSPIGMWSSRSEPARHVPRTVPMRSACLSPVRRSPWRGIVRWWCAVAVGLAAAAVQGARDDNLIAQLRAQIRAIEQAPAVPGGVPEQQRSERRLAGLRRELAVIEKRQDIEARERNLRATANAQPQAQLHERLQALPVDSAATEGKLGELAARRVKATAEREALVGKLAEARRVPVPAAAPDAGAVETEERVIGKDEELRAIALRTEAAENEGELIRFGQMLRDRLKAAEAAAAHPTIRAVLAKGAEEGDDAKLAALFAARLANLEENLRNSEAGLALQREKVAGFDEEIRLLDGRPGGQRRTPLTDQILASDRLQQKMVTERLPFVAEQVEALRLSRDAVRAQQDMLALAGRVRADELAAMRAVFLGRLRAPATVIAALVLIYVGLSRVVLPYRYKKEALLLARRVGRYLVIFLALVVIALAAIDDVRMLATTLGVASAGLVIALQDVATSVFGWFVIMSSGKFTIGDRLEIDGARGDVLDIQLLRTTLVEVNNWLGVDQPTGRVFIVPNNFVFKSRVFNYSHGHPYTWGVVDVTVTYATPAASALALFQKVLEEETQESFAEARQAAAVMERRYGVEDADYHPKVYTRLADSGVTFSLLYVCHYRHTPMMRNRINRRIIAELEKHPHIRLAYPTRQLVTAADVTGLPSAVLGRDETKAPFGPPPAG